MTSRGRPALPLAALLLATVVAAPPAAALDPQKRLTQYLLESWQTDQGLPENVVYSLLQTRDGYLWVGTTGGLCRFDGVRFTVFDRSNTPAIPNDWIEVLIEGRDGTVWIGTQGGGLVRLRDGVFTNLTKDGPFGELLVRSILESPDGSLLVGVDGSGVFRLKDGRFTSFTTKDGLASDSVMTIVEDGAGMIWIGTARGLTGVSRVELEKALDGKGRAAVTQIGTEQGLVNRYVRCQAMDRDGLHWIGTNAGIQEVKDGGLTAYSTKDGLRSDTISRLYVDPRGTLWAGTYGGGVARRKADGTFESLSMRDGLADERVYPMLEDREGSLWMGTGAGGLNRFRDGKVTCFSTKEGLASNNIYSVLEDREGAVWAASFRDGLSRVKEGKVTTYSAANGLASNDTTMLLSDRSGTLWLNASGATWIRDGRVERPTFVTKEGAPARAVGPFLEDRHGDVWAGLPGGGVARLAAGKGPATLLELPPYKVLDLIEDHAGNVWIATEYGGIHRYSNGTLTTFTKKDGLPIENAWALHEDGEGTLWIGTFESGLIRMKDGRFRLLTVRDGLADDGVATLVEDGRGNLWTCGGRGISRLDLAQLNDVADGRKQKVTPELFAVPEGLRIPECAAGSGPSGFLTKDGRLLFATPNGIAMIDPGRIPRNPTPPPVKLEDVLVNGVRVALPRDGATLQLDAGVTRLEIRYAALSYRVPRRVRFRTRLEGFDNDFSDVGTERTSRYTSVAPGDYTFRVKACNEDGVWNEAGAAISFHVRPSAAQTWWFYGLLALGLVGLGVAAQRARVVRLKEQREELLRVVAERTASLAERTRNLEVERERAEAERLKAEAANRAKSVFLANMSHELRTPLNAVLGFAQLMGRKRGRDPEDLEHLAIIGRSGEHLLGLINDVLSLSKVEAGAVTVSAAPFEPSQLLKGISEMLRVRAEGKGLELVFLEPEGFPAAVVGDEGKLRQILINLLGNAVKFTERGHVEFEARWVAGTARFDVEDTGPGLTREERERLFEPFVQTDAGRKAVEGTGLGLTISRSYARLMGGELDVVSAPGKGSVFTLTLPLPAATDEVVVARRRRDRRRVVGLAASERQPKILVADDVAENRLLLTRLLQSTGFAVMEAVDGEDAIQAFRRESPDLIFMDLRMPVLGGLEATRRIRELERERAAKGVRIVALSASVLQHEQGDILAAGCDGFLAKPFRDAAIFAVLGELLEVRFEYEGIAEGAPRPSGTPDGGALTIERLRTVPAPLLERLRAAVNVGDDEEAGRLAEEIGRDDAQLGEALGKLVKEFQLSRLMTLLETMKP